MFTEVSEIFSRGVWIFSVVLKLSLFGRIENFFLGGGRPLTFFQRIKFSRGIKINVKVLK